MSGFEDRITTLESVREKTRRAWDLAADRYHERFHDEMSGKAYDLALLEAFASRFDSASLVLDAGCGPCASAGRIIQARGIPVIGVDISARCVELAREHHPEMPFALADLASLGFGAAALDGILSYYSIIDTPKRYVPMILREFRRVLVPGGPLLLVVKAGTEEGWKSSLLDLDSEIYVSAFSEDEVRRLLEGVGFAIESLESREPYPFEIDVRRIYAVARAPGRGTRSLPRETDV